MRRKWIPGLVLVCTLMIFTGAAPADDLVYFNFEKEPDAAALSLQIIADFDVPKAGPAQEDAAPSPSPTATPTPSPTPEVTKPAETPAPTVTPQMNTRYPQAALEAMQRYGIDPDDVININDWWNTTSVGDTYALYISDCVVVNGIFYQVMAECPPFEKSVDMTPADLTTLINMMAGTFTRVYPAI